MKYSYAHYRIHGRPGFSGNVHGVEFKDGEAYINTREMGEEAAHVALQKIGSDPRGFEIVEITENRTYEGVRDPIVFRRPIEEPDEPKKPARK